MIQCVTMIDLLAKRQPHPLADIGISTSHLVPSPPRARLCAGAGRGGAVAAPRAAGAGPPVDGLLRQHKLFVAAGLARAPGCALASSGLPGSRSGKPPIDLRRGLTADIS